MFERLLFLALNWLVLFICIAITGDHFVNKWPSIYVVILLWSMLLVIVFFRIKRKDVMIVQVIASFVWTGFLLPGYYPRRERYWFETEYTFFILFAVMMVFVGVDLWRVFKKKQG